MSSLTFTQVLQLGKSLNEALKAEKTGKPVLNPVNDLLQLFHSHGVTNMDAPAAPFFAAARDDAFYDAMPDYKNSRARARSMESILMLLRTDELRAGLGEEVHGEVAHRVNEQRKVFEADYRKELAARGKQTGARKERRARKEDEEGAAAAEEPEDGGKLFEEFEGCGGDFHFLNVEEHLMDARRRATAAEARLARVVELVKTFVRQHGDPLWAEFVPGLLDLLVADGAA